MDFIISPIGRSHWSTCYLIPGVVSVPSTMGKISTLPPPGVKVQGVQHWLERGLFSPWPEVPLEQQKRQGLTEDTVDWPRSQEFRGQREVSRVALAAEIMAGEQD